MPFRKPRSGGRLRKRCAFLTGKERDPESNNDYFGARYYWNGAGRWLSVDPVSQIYPQSLNSYSYVLNDPVNRSDPDGRVSLPGEEGSEEGMCVIGKGVIPGLEIEGKFPFVVCLYWAPYRGRPGWEQLEPRRPLDFGQRARNALSRRLKRTGEGCKSFLSQKMGAGWASTMQTDAKSTTFYNPENIAGIQVKDLPGVTGDFNYTYLSEAWEKVVAAGAQGMVVTNTDGKIFAYAVIKSGLNNWNFEESVFGEQLHITTGNGDVGLYNAWGLNEIYNTINLDNSNADHRFWASKWLHEFLANDCKKPELP